MDNSQVNYIYTRDLKNMEWPLIREKMEKHQGTKELVITLGSNNIFPCCKENLHYHFNSRFPCNRDEYVERMTDLIDLASPLFKKITVLPPLPRLLEKQCKCQNAAYYPGSLETVTTLTLQLRNTVKKLEDCSVSVVTINQLMKGIYIANKPTVNKWITGGFLPPNQSLGQLARERRNTRTTLGLLSKDSLHFSNTGYHIIGKGICYLLQSNVGHPLDGTDSLSSTGGPGGATSQ